MLRAPRRQRAVAAVAGRRRRRPRLAVAAVDVGDPGQSSDEEPGIVHIQLAPATILLLASSHGRVCCALQQHVIAVPSAQGRMDDVKSLSSQNVRRRSKIKRTRTESVKHAGMHVLADRT